MIAAQQFRVSLCETRFLFCHIHLYTQKGSFKSSLNYFRINYALFTLPKSSIFSLTFALIASKPGARSFLGSKPLP